MEPGLGLPEYIYIYYQEALHTNFLNEFILASTYIYFLHEFIMASAVIHFMHDFIMASADIHFPQEFFLVSADVHTSTFCSLKKLSRLWINSPRPRQTFICFMNSLCKHKVDLSSPDIPFETCIYLGFQIFMFRTH